MSKPGKREAVVLAPGEGRNYSIKSACRAILSCLLARAIARVIIVPSTICTV